MSVIDDIKGLLGEFRSGLAKLAQQDRAHIEEAQDLRRTLARQASTLDEQRAIIAKLTAAKTTSEKHVDKLTDEAATLRAQLDQAALVLGKKRDRLDTAGADPAEPKIPDGREAEELRVGIEKILQDEAFDFDSDDYRPLHVKLSKMLDRVDARDSFTYLEHVEAALQAHVRALLRILDAVCGFQSTESQDAIRAAREAVTGG